MSWYLGSLKCARFMNYFFFKKLKDFHRNPERDRKTQNHPKKKQKRKARKKEQKTVPYSTKVPYLTLPYLTLNDSIPSRTQVSNSKGENMRRRCKTTKPNIYSIDPTAREGNQNQHQNEGGSNNAGWRRNESPTTLGHAAHHL